MKNFPLVWKTSPSQLSVPGRAGTSFRKRGNSHLRQVLWPFIVCWCRGGCDAAASDWLGPGTATAASPAKPDGDRNVHSQPGRERRGDTPGSCSANGQGTGLRGPRHAEQHGSALAPGDHRRGSFSAAGDEASLGSLDNREALGQDYLKNSDLGGHSGQQHERRGVRGGSSAQLPLLHPVHPAAKLPAGAGAAGDCPRTQRIPWEAGPSSQPRSSGPWPARHELASARHRVRKGLTHSLAGCHPAKLLTNSSGCLPERPGAAAPASQRHLKGVIFQAILVVIPPQQRMGRMRIIRQRVENETGITGETRRSA